MPPWQYLLVSKCCQEPLSLLSGGHPWINASQGQTADGMVCVVSGGDNVTRMFS